MSLPIVILGLAVAGARLSYPPLILAMTLLICLYVGLVVYNKVNSRGYPFAIYLIGLSLLLQTTLISNYLIGTDIHTEYYFYNLVREGGWDTTIPHAYNSCIGTTVLAPLLPISGYWVYKLIFPCLFAFVPVLLYYIFRKEFGSKVAFLSCFFFVVIPTWSLEMIGLPRQQLTEIMFAACLFLILVSSWSLRVRVPLLVVCTMLGLMFHYATGPGIIIYLGLGGIFLLFFRERRFPVKWLGLVVGITSVFAIFYYSSVCQGIPLQSLSGSLYAQLGRILPTPAVPTIPSVPGIPLPPTAVEGTVPILSGQEPLIRMALGLDFFRVGILGKMFRIFQFATEACIIIGCLYLVRYRKKFSPEYLSLVGVSVVMLGACLILPRFSNIINVTRFYHLALFLLAPTFILGCMNKRLLLLGVMIPYFLFCSGFVFEVAKYEDVGKINIPYSVALSNDRVELVGVYTDNDVAVRDWAVDNELQPIYLDVNGMLLFSERMGPFKWRDTWAYPPTDLEELEGGYIYLRERNNQRREVTYKPNYFNPGESATGMRISYTYEEIGLDKVLEEGKIIYRKGDATIVELEYDEIPN